MIDIEKFNKKFEEILESTTKEDMQKWLDNKDKAEQEELKKS